MERAEPLPATRALDAFERSTGAQQRRKNNAAQQARGESDRHGFNGVSAHGTAGLDVGRPDRFAGFPHRFLAALLNALAQLARLLARARKSASQVACQFVEIAAHLFSTGARFLLHERNELLDAGARTL